MSFEKALVAINKIEALEDWICDGKLPQVDCPLVHRFAPGIYAREITIPAGTIVTGAIHKHSHLNNISKGKVTVFTYTDSEPITMEAPFSFVSEPGIKRAVYVHPELECVWTTYHYNPDNETNLEILTSRYTFSEVSDLLGGNTNKQLRSLL